MMQKGYSSIFLLIFMIGNLYADSSDSVFEPILAQYEIALKDLIGVYQSMQPPLPIQFNQSDVIGATYHKIIWPYVLELQGYSNVAMSAYSRKYPYYSDMQELQKKFKEYDQKVLALSKLFPAEIQQDAIDYFYNQLTGSLVQNCAKILQGIAYALNTDSQSLDIALIAYDLAWNAQTATMKLTGFADVATFKSNMMTWIVNVYEAAITNLTTQLQKSDNKGDLYDQIASCYQALAMVYTNSGNAQKATIEKQNATQIQAQKKQYLQAKSLTESAKKQADEARVHIVVDFLKPAESIQSIQNLLSGISSAYKAYESALTIYTTLQDSAAINNCNAQIDQLQGDFATRKIQLLWLFFAQNKYISTVSADSIQAFTDLQKFYTSDANKETVSTDLIIQALTDLLNLCTQAPNNFDTHFSISSLLQSATQSYQAALVGVPTNQQDLGNKDSFLVDTKTLQALQKSLSAFVEIINGMIGIGHGQAMISGSNILAQMMVQAKNIDKIFVDNNLLKNFFFYFPDLEVDTEGKRSFQSFVVQYVYRIALSKVQSYIAPSSTQAGNDELTMMLALSDLITLQGYKDYITDTQLQELQKSIIALAETMNIEQYAQSVYKQAQNSNNWANIATAGNGYQSKTDSLWNIAISLCEIGIDLSMLPNVAAATKLSTTVLQEIYIAILQDYVKAFVANAPQLSGYQLHVFTPLYKLYTATTLLNENQPAFLKDKSVISFAQQALNQLFGGKSGFFAQVKLAQVDASSSGMSAQQKTEKEELIAQLMNQINIVIEQQALAMSKLVQLLSLSQEPNGLLDSVTDGVTMTVTMQLGTNTYKVQLTNPIAVKINKLTGQITTSQAAATQAESKQDFVSAATLYGNIKQYCLELLPILPSSNQVQNYKDTYFLANTRFTASTLAAQVVVKNMFALNSLKNIPKNYYVQNYHLNNIDMQLLGGTMPASLQSLKTLTVLSNGQIQDAVAVFKAYIISELLQPQGLTFSSCYSGYALQKQSGLSSDNIQILADIEAKVEAYLKQWKNINISAMVDGANISLVLNQLPISPVVPLYDTAPYATIYFIGAAELFQPGKALVDGGQYVPGQDEASYNTMLESIAYAYVSAAQQELSKVEAIAKGLTIKVTKSVSAKKVIDEALFMQKYNRIKQGFIAAQSLLFATGSSAYYYFNLLGETDKAETVKQLFLDSYRQQVGIMSGFLIGNPVSNIYNTVLSDLNQVYLSWCVELDPVKDAAKIAQNKKEVVELFEMTGDACMNYVYEQSMFPNLQQYHYMTAASNYEAAKQQCVTMLNDSQQASTMRNKALQAYFFACTQKIMAYYYAKNNGVVYTPVAMLGYDTTVSTQPTQISFSDLFSAYQSFENAGNINQGKIDAYNDLQKLLLDGAMYFQYLAGVYEKQVKPAAVPQGKSKQKKVLDSQLLHYLQGQNIITAQGDVIPFVQSDMLPKLFNMADQVFIKFQNNVAALADWCNSLYTAIQYQYIDDYQGGIDPKISSADQATEFLKKWQSFSIAMQKESSALENPSSAYIG